MEKLKVAILEDSPMMLKSLEVDLEKTQLVEVIISATNSTDFLEKINAAKADALILDIDLVGDSMSGLDIANKLKLPVLFVSGKTIEFNHGIEELNMNSSIPVQHISKPITLDKLKKILPKFINEINTINRAKFIRLDFSESKRNKIEIDTIVYIETETGNSGASNNKRIYFTDNKPETLNNFSFVDMEKLGFDSKIFIQPHKSFRVNISKVKCYNNEHTLDVEIKNDLKKNEVKKIPVSENYRKQTLESLKKRFSLP